MSKNRMRILLYFLFALALLIAYPVRSKWTAVGTVGLSLCCLGLLVPLLPKTLRFIAFATPPFLVICLYLLPRKPYQAAAIRQHYLDRLLSYEGVRYVWGGENSIGIDCSGIVRQSLILANLDMGLEEANGERIRRALQLWWNDLSAKSLLHGAGGQTQFVKEADNLLALDWRDLQGGDIAVTSDGRHVLSYLGNQEWIEADPFEHKVVRLNHASKSLWLRVPVRIVRWVEMSTPQ